MDRIIKRGSVGIVGLLVVWITTVAAEKKEFIDPMEHDVVLITPQSFLQQIAKNRDDRVQALLFHKNDAASKTFLNDHFNPLAMELKGWITLGAIDCGDHPKLCGDHNATEFPSVLVLPPNPIPSFFHSKGMTQKDIKPALLRYVPSNITNLTSDMIDKWLTSHLAVPKVILFSNKATPAVLFKAISTSFNNNLDFGFIPETESDLTSRFSIKTFPTLQVHRHEKKTDTYKGEMKFKSLFDWVNLFSETFVKGGGYDHAGGVEESKPWLIEQIPEVTRASHKDVCFKGDKGLCVIYLKEGGPLDKNETQMMADLSSKFTSHIADRGTQMRWLWMDLSKEMNFKEFFGVTTLPSLVVVNPHKRLRFTAIGEDEIASGKTIANLMDKILGGDARFKNIKSLPEWSEAASTNKKIEL